MPPEMKPVESSHIAAAGYDPQTREAVISFKNGATYTYEGVTPELASGFESARSKGQFFATHIKPLKSRRVEQPKK